MPDVADVKVGHELDASLFGFAFLDLVDGEGHEHIFEHGVVGDKSTVLLDHANSFAEVLSVGTVERARLDRIDANAACCWQEVCVQESEQGGLA